MRRDRPKSGWLNYSFLYVEPAEVAGRALPEYKPMFVSLIRSSGKNRSIQSCRRYSRANYTLTDSLPEEEEEEDLAASRFLPRLLPRTGALNRLCRPRWR
jgi:hypothetical protein